MAEIALFEMAHLKTIEEVVEKEQIDCDLVFTRALNVTLDENVAARLEVLVNTIQNSRPEFVED